MIDATDDLTPAILTAVRAAVAAGAVDWEHPAAAEAVRLTGDAGWSWDFTTWREALADIEACAAAAETAAETNA
jgi:hypothetical protein